MTREVPDKSKRWLCGAPKCQVTPLCMAQVIAIIGLALFGIGIVVSVLVRMEPMGLGFGGFMATVGFLMIVGGIIFWKWDPFKKPVDFPPIPDDTETGQAPFRGIHGLGPPPSYAQSQAGSVASLHTIKSAGPTQAAISSIPKQPINMAHAAPPHKPGSVYAESSTFSNPAAQSVNVDQLRMPVTQSQQPTQDVKAKPQSTALRKGNEARDQGTRDVSFKPAKTIEGSPKRRSKSEQRIIERRVLATPNSRDVDQSVSHRRISVEYNEGVTSKQLADLLSPTSAVHDKKQSHHIREEFYRSPAAVSVAHAAGAHGFKQNPVPPGLRPLPYAEKNLPSAPPAYDSVKPMTTEPGVSHAHGVRTAGNAPHRASVHTTV